MYLYNFIVYSQTKNFNLIRVIPKIYTIKCSDLKKCATFEMYIFDFILKIKILKSTKIHVGNKLNFLKTSSFDFQITIYNFVLYTFSN